MPSMLKVGKVPVLLLRLVLPGEKLSIYVRRETCQKRSLTNQVSNHRRHGRRHSADAQWCYRCSLPYPLPHRCQGIIRLLSCALRSCYTDGNCTLLARHTILDRQYCYFPNDSSHLARIPGYTEPPTCKCRYHIERVDRSFRLFLHPVPYLVDSTV
jgi:hypothetical protein